MHIGKKIKSVRILQGYSQQELAARIERSAHLVGHIERSGRVAPETLDKICRVLRLTPDELALQPFHLKRKQEIDRKIEQLEKDLSHYRQYLSIVKMQLDHIKELRRDESEARTEE